MGKKKECFSLFVQNFVNAELLVCFKEVSRGHIFSSVDILRKSSFYRGSEFLNKTFMTSEDMFSLSK